MTLRARPRERLTTGPQAAIRDRQMTRTRELVCMMAKAPEPGQVKTRLCPPLSADQAARLSAAFIADTWRMLASLPAGDTIATIALAGDPRHLPIAVRKAETWSQASGDLGARIEQVIATGLERADRVIVIGSDAPALPSSLVREAGRALSESDAVMGPALDGGYYLLGMRRCEPGLFSALPWSAPHTRAATIERLEERGYTVAHLPSWFDVDDADGLSRLRRLLADPTIEAPATRRLLPELP